ncbi:MAG TPA: TIGR01777 family oxidoreductase [Panacibacter sp.]|nr:TIGR01777 family oxidoreductase [Panacibacter sp.]
MATVLITGGTGLIGKALSPMLLRKGYEVIILTRNPTGTTNIQPGISFAKWNIETGEIDKSAIAKADYIIHLAGAGVAEKRWTDKRKTEIIESRTKSGALLINALSKTENHVKAVISSSAIGWYGPDTPTSLQKGFDEDWKSSDDFLGKTCKLWEAAIQPVEALGKRLVILRTGIVLSNDGGALAEFKKPLKFGIASILGGGNQITSWIHIDDICRMYLFAIETNISGIYNAVAPHPVTNKQLTLTLAKSIKGNAFVSMHVPGFVLKIMLGEMSVEVLKSANVSVAKFQHTGFQFAYPTIEAALKELAFQK